MTDLPKRSPDELAIALRQRADYLTGEAWEVPATVAMMREAAHALDESTWQPIETAPKDGTLIIGALIRDGKVWRVHDMKHNGIAFYTIAGGSLPQMTHWTVMPTPDARKE